MTFKSSLYILFTFFLVGCISQKENHSNGSFEATPVQLLEAPKKVSSNELGLTNKKLFTLKTCFFDKATLEPKIGEKFFVTISGKKIPLSLLEPKSGCVSWEEAIQFEPLAAENNVYFSRTFESSASGNITLPFSLDPWVNGSDVLTDLRTSPTTPHTEEARSAFALAGKSEYDPKIQLPPGRFSNLSIENIDGQLVNAGESNGFLRRELSISFKGALFRKSKDNGETKLIPSSGRAQVKAAILEIKPDVQTKRLVTDIEMTEGNWKDGRLDVKFSFNVPGNIQEDSELAFVYRVESVDQPNLIIPIEGEKNFTRDRIVKLSGTPKEYAANGSFAPGIARREDKPLNTRSFIISSWKVNFLKSEPYNPVNWEAKTQLEFEVCLRDSFTRSPLVAHPFSVLVSQNKEWDEKSSRPLRPTNELGCAKWDQTITYPYADQEDILNYFVLVKDEKYKTSNNIQSILVGLNPWQKGPLVFRDNELLGTSVKAEVNPEEKGIFLKVNNVGYEAEKRSFEVDSHLYLTSLKKYQFHLRPYFQRASSVDKVLPEEAVLPNTKIKVVGALVQNLETDVKNDSDRAYQEGFLSGFETEATVDSQKALNFEAVFPVEFSHLPKLDSRLKVVLKLTPIGKGILPHETVIAAKFKADPLTEEGSATSLSYEVSQLIPENLIKSKKIRKIAYSNGSSYALQSPWKKSPMALYQDFWNGFSNLVTISVGEKPIDEVSGSFKHFLSSMKFSQQEESDLKEFFLKQNFSLFTPALKAFCKGLMGTSTDKKDYESCVKEPSQFFQVNTFNLMEDFDRAPAEVVKSKKINLNVTASFTTEDNFVEREIAGDKHAKQFSFNLSGRLGYEHFGSGAGVGAGFSKQHDVYRAVESAVTSEISQRINLNELMLLRGESKTLQFSASYRSCIFVRPLAIVQMTIPLRSFLFCFDPRAEKIQETWYFLQEATYGGGPVFGDDKDPKERNWVKLIRGNRLYEEFLGQVADKSKARLFELKKVSVFKDGLENVLDPNFTEMASRERLKSDGAVFPGMSDFKEFTSLHWTEPQISERTKNVVAAYLSKVPENRKQDEKLISRIYKASRCYIESIAREMPYSKFLENLNGVLADEKRVAREEFCHRFAKVE